MTDLTVLGPLVVVLLAAAVVGAFALAARRRTDGLARRFAMLAEQRGWERASSESAVELLRGFDGYLDGRWTVAHAITGEATTGRVLLAHVATRDSGGEARPWFVAVAVTDDLDAPQLWFQPRSVRNVRILDGSEEPPVVDDRAFMRRWQLRVADREAAARFLTPAVRNQLQAAADRYPWPVGIQVRDQRVAVHLAREHDVPADADELGRLVRLADDLAGLLRDARDRQS